MGSPSFEEVFPIARKLAQKKARIAIGRCGLSAADQEDIALQLLSTLWRRFPKFDPNRASIQTFASRLMDNELQSILRYRLAKRRRHLLVSGPMEVHPMDENHIETGKAPSPIERRQFWVDVERALASCPTAGLLETADALSQVSPTELAQSTSRSRTTVYFKIHHLREALNAAGIGLTYFAAARGDR